MKCSEMFMAMWCEILCFQYHPCGLRKLSLSTQGNCFSERRAECMGALCSQRWKKVQHHKSGLIWKKALSLCVSGFLTILLWEKCVNPKEQETDSCFLVPLIPVIYFKDIFRPSYLIFLLLFLFFPLLIQMLSMSCFMNNTAFVCGKTEEVCIRRF